MSALLDSLVGNKVEIITNDGRGMFSILNKMTIKLISNNLSNTLKINHRPWENQTSIWAKR